MEKEITLPLVEHFVSINGEGQYAGELSLFLRFAGCNLSCSYCDTMWANKGDVKADAYTITQLVDLVLSSGVKRITITGGEPLCQPDMLILVKTLVEQTKVIIEIETNGSKDIKPYQAFDARVHLTVDYKSPSSLMEDYMLRSNYEAVREIDTVKFVVGSMEDLLKAKEIIETYKLAGRTHIYLSPVFGNIKAESIVDFMKEHQMKDVRMQLQLHKYIWDPNKKGV